MIPLAPKNREYGRGDGLPPQLTSKLRAVVRPEKGRTISLNEIRRPAHFENHPLTPLDRMDNMDTIGQLSDILSILSILSSK